MTEQYSLGGKAKADLAVGCFAIEIKLKGLFGSDQVARYGRCMQAAQGMGLHYLFITKEESYRPYREGVQRTLGVENAYFLDTVGDWERFVSRIAGELRNPRER